jgi:hypothetical protein
MIPKIEIYEFVDEKPVYKAQANISAEITKLLYIAEVMADMEFENLRDSDICHNCYNSNKSPYDSLLDYLEEKFENIIIEKFTSTQPNIVDFFQTDEDDKSQGIYAKIYYYNTFGKNLENK